MLVAESAIAQSELLVLPHPTRGLRTDCSPSGRYSIDSIIFLR